MPRCLRVLAGHRHSVVSIEFAPSGSSITTASLDRVGRNFDCWVDREAAQGTGVNERSVGHASTVAMLK